MNAIKKARKFVADKPMDPDAQVLSRLVLALESEHPFALSELYGMNLARFDLAMEVLKEWRLDRYYASKIRLFDMSVQIQELHSGN